MRQITYMHFDFPAPKDSLQAMQKRNKIEKGEQTSWGEKNTDIPFNFYIIVQDTNSLTLFL